MSLEAELSKYEGQEHEEIATSLERKDAEIERLRATLKQIIDAYPYTVVRSDPIGIMFETAKIAYEQKAPEEHAMGLVDFDPEREGNHR